MRVDEGRGNEGWGSGRIAVSDLIRGLIRIGDVMRRKFDRRPQPGDLQLSLPPNSFFATVQICFDPISLALIRIRPDLT